MLTRTEKRTGPWGEPLEDLYRANPRLTDVDRAFISHLVLGVWRWRGRLDWIIEKAAGRPLKKISPLVLNILRLAVYQIFHMDRVPESAAVNEGVRQAKTRGAAHAAPFVNGLLRNLCRNKEVIEFPDRREDPVRYLSEVHSYPAWLVGRWIEVFGEKETEALLEAQNRIPALDVRTNRLKTNPESLVIHLEKEGVSALPHERVPDAVRITGLRGRVSRLEAFQQGLFQVQDTAAQIVAHLLSPAPGERVLDVCAGLGGKSTHLAELSGDRAGVTALDVSHGRLVRLKETSRRLGLAGIHTVAADAASPLDRLFRTKFQAVLVDAPCTGLGVLSRHPDAKWRRSGSDPARLAELQRQILLKAARVLSPGGRMLFITCTLTEEENQGVVESFLGENGRVRLLNLRETAPPWARDYVDPQGFFRTLPHVHGMDGFFGALFVYN